MVYIFTTLFIASLVYFFIAIVKPSTAIFWKKTPVTRKQALKFYGIAMIITFIGVCATVPPLDKTARADEPAGTEKRDAAPPTEEDMEHALARSCDTNWRFISRPEKYLHDTGYIIDPYDVRISGGEWQTGPWTMSTYKQTGPSAFDEDDKRRLTLYQPVRVLDTKAGRSGDFDLHFLVVSPLGSNEQYIIDETDFTLKNVNECTLLQKAKNGFFARAVYMASSDPAKRPINDAGEKWIDMPPGAHILIFEYRANRNTLVGTIYDAEGQIFTPAAHFYLETLKEIR